MSWESLPLLLSLVATAFVGSWHCAAMCGPIAIALGKENSLLPYHLGRGLAYISLGTLAGFIGKSVFLQWSTETRIVGAIALSICFIVALHPRGLQNWVQSFKLFQKITSRKPGRFVFGLSSILLPCGWLWTFVASSVASGSPWTGALIMAVLWASSLPVLSVMNLYFRRTLPLTSGRHKFWLQAFLVVAGLYSIWSHFLF